MIANPKPMALWAALIAVLDGGRLRRAVSSGCQSFFRLIGHATWHAYVDVFGAD